MLLTVTGAGVSLILGWSFLVRLAPGVLTTQSFLSGAVPVEHAVSRYHVRWYTITMVFLAFDMEMVCMYPWAVVVAQIGPAGGDRDVRLPGGARRRRGLRLA